MSIPDKVKEELVRVLGNLCAGYEEQVSYLKRIGTYPDLDELALEFDDVFIMLQVESNPYSLNSKLLEGIKKVNTFLEQKSGDVDRDFWDIVKSDQTTWDTLRALAKDTLGQLQNRA